MNSVSLQTGDIRLVEVLVVDALLEVSGSIILLTKQLKFLKKRDQVGTTLLYNIGAEWITIIYRSVKFESNDKYHYVR